jgi:hypothetical protein
MPFDEKAADRVRRVLARRRGIAEKKMMGALCFMVNGTMCCGVTGDALMVRVGREAFDDLLKRPHVRPLEIGQRATRGFVLIDPPGYRMEAALTRWIEHGLATAKTLRSRAAQRPPSTRRRPV